MIDIQFLKNKKDRNFIICISITIIIVIALIMSGSNGNYHKSNLDQKSTNNIHIDQGDEYSDEYGDGSNNKNLINDGQDINTE